MIDARNTGAIDEGFVVFMPIVDRFDFREQERRFAVACAWLEDLGVSVNGTRVAEYRGLLEKVAEYHERGRIDALMQEVGYLLLQNAVLEAAEFIDIHAALGGSQDKLVAERLQAFVGGAQLLSAETANGNRARNIGFELSIAAAAVSAGLPIDLRPPGDISIPVPAYPCFVECKRPFSRSKVGNRIREGLRQLVTRYDGCRDPRSARGFLAVSISRIEHGGSAYIRGADESALDAQLNGVLDAFIFRYRHHWEERVDPRTVAVLVELRAPCVIANPSLFLTARHYGWAMIYPPGTSERQLLGSAIAEPFQRVTRDRSHETPKR